MENPYTPPESEYEPSLTDDLEEKTAPPIAIEHLRGTRPWVRFCSIAGYVTSLFILIISIILTVKVTVFLPTHNTILLGSFYIVLGLLFLIPSIRLSQYERSITRLIVTSRTEDLEQALAHQRAFWKQMAIMILILTVLYLITVTLSALMILSGRI